MGIACHETLCQSIQMLGLQLAWGEFHGDNTSTDSWHSGRDSR